MEYPKRLSLLFTSCSLTYWLPHCRSLHRPESITMVDWKTPKEIEAEGVPFIKAVYVLFGIYIWEICTTGRFELSIFLGRRKLTWPLVFFFLCRYSMLLAFIGLIIFVNVYMKIDCNALYTFTFIAGNLTILSASTSLMIRTMDALGVETPGSSVNACPVIWTVRDPNLHHNDRTSIMGFTRLGTCVVVRTNHILLSLNYAYTMSFDFVILVMTLFVLRKRFRHEDLSTLLCRDGLVYFLITSTCNTVPAVLAALNLNDEMNVIAMVPAAAVSAIAACRVFIRLDAYNKGNGEKLALEVLLHRRVLSASCPCPVLRQRSKGFVSRALWICLAHHNPPGASPLTSATATALRSTPGQTRSILGPHGDRRLIARISPYIRFGSAV
ncbi:hypothetical protein F4604DRAFT_1949041 [Suillus subluteus]|nr:hypothetical protein F4604DRAFT_1949041 [Suillus subluteus]